jgi:hypothetical protein
MSYDGTVRTSEVFVPLTEKYILMTYFRRDMSLSTQSKHSHLENKGPLNQRLLQRERSSKAFTILSSMLALALTLAPTVLPAEAADNDIDQGGRFWVSIVSMKFFARRLCQPLLKTHLWREVPRILLETIVATAKLRSSPFPWSRMDDWSSGLPTYSLFAQAIS